MQKRPLLSQTEAVSSYPLPHPRGGGQCVVVRCQVSWCACYNAGHNDEQGTRTLSRCPAALPMSYAVPSNCFSGSLPAGQVHIRPAAATCWPYNSSVVQLAAWMALSVSRSWRESASAFFRYSGTGTVLKTLISVRIPLCVRLLAAMRKSW